jgi:site-specific DNA-methyltransferase (adenine-specific)
MGNPPYQEMDGGNRASAKPLYNRFIDKSILITKIICMIVPSRWFAGGKGLDEFRKKMIESNSIKLIKHFGNNGFEVFGNNASIAGGVSYFLYDKSHNSNKFYFNNVLVEQKYDIILREPHCYSILEKVHKYESISNLCRPRSFYGIATNDNRLVSEKICDDYLKCFVSQQKGFVRYINGNLINKSLTSHKVVTSRAYMKAEDGLGNLFYAEPSDVVTDSYIFLTCDSESQSKSLITYLKTKFVKYLICLRKIDSSIKPSTFLWVPKVPLDREWTDEQLFEYFNLTEEEKNLISNYDKK